MHFDASPRSLKELNDKLRQDPRVVRWTMSKLGDNVNSIVKPPGQTSFMNNPFGSR